MISVLKWIFIALLAVFSWLVTVITLEYYRPYKKVPIHLR